MLSCVGYCVVVLNVSDHGYRTVGNVDHRVAQPHVHQVYVHNNGTLSLAFHSIGSCIALPWKGPCVDLYHSCLYGLDVYLFSIQCCLYS